MNEQPIRPDLVEGPEGEEEVAHERSAVLQPTKLIRIASMTRAMLEEVRQAELDEAGRMLLMDVHERSLDELRGVLSSDLLEEFNDIFQPLHGEGVPSESVLRMAQAQLIGWLEGLFHGIQASLWSQQMVAQAQLAEMQQRRLEPPQEEEDRSSGLYL